VAKNDVLDDRAVLFLITRSPDSYEIEDVERERKSKN